MSPSLQPEPSSPRFVVRVMEDGTIEAQPGLQGFGPEAFDEMIEIVVGMYESMGREAA